jgi:hypothetical protein
MTDIKQYDDVFRKALETWGGESQENMAIEECSEFIKAICKYRRNAGHKEVDDIIDEIADVTIMMRQMTIAIGEEAVEIKIKEKVNRLAGRLGYQRQ